MTIGYKQSRAINSDSFPAIRLMKFKKNGRTDIMRKREREREIVFNQSKEIEYIAIQFDSSGQIWTGAYDEFSSFAAKTPF